MRRFLKELFSAPFQLVLVISFSLVAATTIVVGTWVISRTIRDDLAEAMTAVDRDMRLADSREQVARGGRDRLRLASGPAGARRAGAGKGRCELSGRNGAVGA